MPKTYEPIVSTIPVAMKTSAYSFESTNFVRFDRITAMEIKKKLPKKAAIQNKISKSIETFNEISYQDRAAKFHELNQKEQNVQYTLQFQKRVSTLNPSGILFEKYGV